MYYFALLLYVAISLPQVFGGNTQIGRSRHKCLRDDDGTVKGCIHKGEVINENECAKRCKSFMKSVKYTGALEAICRDFDECSCIYYPDDSAIECDSLDNLEESQYRKEKRAKSQQVQFIGTTSIGPSYYTVGLNTNFATIGSSDSSKRCFYRGHLITAEECHKRCVDFGENTNFIGTAKGACENYTGCICQSFRGEFVSWNRLDTLEAQYKRKVADEDAKESESKKKNRKRNKLTYSRIQNEMYTGASCSRWNPDNQLEALDFRQIRLSE